MAGAEPGYTPGRIGLSALWRRGWVVLLTTAIAGAAAYAVADLAEGKPVYSADAVLNVPSAFDREGPSGTSDAIKLAGTFSELIPEDAAITGGAARSLGISPRTLRRRLSIKHETETSILKVAFESPTKAGAKRGAQAVARTAVVGPGEGRVSPNVPRGSLELVRVSDQVKRTDSRPTGGIPIGLLLGFALGVIVLMAWERADRRIDGVDDLRRESGVPASDIGHVSSDEVVAVLQRWQRLGGASPTRVVLHPADSGADAYVSQLASSLAGTGMEHRMDVAATNGASFDGGAALLISPALGAGGRAAVADADLNVAVVPRGSRVAEMRRSLGRMGEFGSEPRWALLAPRRGVLRRLARKQRKNPIRQTAEEPAEHAESR